MPICVKFLYCGITAKLNKGFYLTKCFEENFIPYWNKF